MKPFYEHTNEKTGRKERVYWSDERVAEKLDEFVKEAKDFMNKRDLEKGRAMGLPIPEGIDFLPTMYPDEKGEMVVNPLAVHIKHSGAETVDRWKPRWEEFCSKPQSDELMTYPKPTYKPKQPPRTDGPAQFVTPSAVVAGTPTVKAPVSRKEILAGV